MVRLARTCLFDGLAGFDREVVGGAGEGVESTVDSGAGCHALELYLERLCVCVCVYVRARRCMRADVRGEAPGEAWR